MFAFILLLDDDEPLLLLDADADVVDDVVDGAFMGPFMARNRDLSLSSLALLDAVLVAVLDSLLLLLLLL